MLLSLLGVLLAVTETLADCPPEVLTKASGQFKDAARKPSDSDLLPGTRTSLNLPLCMGQCLKEDGCLTVVFEDNLRDCHLYSSADQVAELDSGQKALTRGRTVKEYGRGAWSMVDFADPSKGTTCQASSHYHLQDCSRVFADGDRSLGWHTADGDTDPWLEITFDHEITFVSLYITQYIEYDYRCSRMTVTLNNGQQEQLSSTCGASQCLEVRGLRGNRVRSVNMTCDAKCGSFMVIDRVNILAIDD